LSPGSSSGVSSSSVVSSYFSTISLELVMDGSEEFEDTSFNFLMKSFVSFDGSLPVCKDLLLVGEFKTGVDNVSIAVDMEWGEVEVFDLKLPCSHVILLDSSFFLKP